MMADPERLMYAMNWEDPRLELEALAVGPEDRVLAVAGAGCTALSLLGRGPRSLDAVDLSRPQLRMVALKRAAVCALPPTDAAAFLGGEPLDRATRMRQFAALALEEDDRAWWTARRRMVVAGALSRGRAERFIAILRALVRLGVHPRRRIVALFEQPTLEAQRRFYHDEWDTPRWRLLFRLLNKRVIDRALDPAFYQFVDPGNLGEQLRLRAERCLTELPVRDNYFFSCMLLGRYLPVSVAAARVDGPDGDGRPPYLQAEGADGVRRYRERLRLHHADLRQWLRAAPADSFDKLYLSNIGEWLPEPALEELLADVVRVARPGARVCDRGLMIQRPLPARLAAQLVVDEPRSAALGARDRAFLNASFRVATVHK
jgi:S-adenosylmethionine-diacylglycerol 3-amino-3-carboxypropyl transferase